MSLSPSYKLPGVTLEEIFGSDSGAVNPNTRCTLFGYVLPSCTKPLNTPFTPGSLQEVIATCAPNSMLTHIYQAARSQNAGAELVLVPMPAPSSGTAATHTITFLAAPSAGVLGSNTAATISDTCTILVRGRPSGGGSFRIAPADTFAVIAANAAAMLQKALDLPVTVSVATATLTLLDVHAGEHGNNCPISVTFSSRGTAGVAASPGTFVFAVTATGAGVATLNLNALSTTATIGATSTIVQSAQAALAAIRASGFCVDAAIPASPTDGTVTLFYRDGIVCERLSVSTTATTQTVAAVGIGVQGSGVPNLTAALAKLKADKRASKVYSVFWEDAANWGALSTHIESETVVPIQKGQTAVGCTTLSGISVRATNLPTSTTPNLTLSPRYVLGWQAGSPQSAWELAARIAAAIAGLNPLTDSQNLNGLALKTSDGVPLGVPHAIDQVGNEENNTMIATYKYAPIAVSGGVNVLVRSSTTYASTGSLDQKLEKISAILACDYMRDSIRVKVKERHGKQTLKAIGKARTSNCTTPIAILDTVYEQLLTFDAVDLFDDAKSIRPAMVASVPSANRVRCYVPLRPVADLDQIDIESPII